MREVSVNIFLLSGVVSLVVIGLYVCLFKAVVKNNIIENSFKSLIVTICGLCVFINTLYFLNVIPPIPLSLEEAVVAHEVVRIDDAYEVTVPDRGFFASFDPKNKITKRPGQPIYMYTSVFAPTRISTNIQHIWQKKDAEGKWQTRSTIPFAISGGRDGGYRGYTLSSQVDAGKWRVLIALPNGQIIGLKSFTVELESTIPPTEKKLF
jgi:hypothetical protein